MNNCFWRSLFFFTVLTVSGIALAQEEVQTTIDSATCTPNCNANQTCQEGTCVCKNGYSLISAENDECEKNICTPPCNSTSEYCSQNGCACNIDYENKADAGAKVECVIKSQSATSTNQSAKTETTSITVLAPKTTLTTPKSNSTTPSPTKPSHPTLKPTITTPKSNSTTLKPTPTPHPKPKKASMSPWAITGIIFLVSGLCGLGGFMIYKYKKRGSYRTASTIDQ